VIVPTYRYKSVSPTGEIVEAEMEAPSQGAIVERLQALGHVPIRADLLRAERGKKGLRRELFARQSVGRHDLVPLTRDLAVLLQAGLALDRALDILCELTTSDRMKRLLTGLLEKLRGGASLADAMTSMGAVFPRFYVSMVRAGEAGGSVEATLARLAHFMERAQAVRESVKSALNYPAILFAVAGLSVVLILTLVVPSFEPMLEASGNPLPLPMRVLVGIGDFFEHYGWLAALAAAVLALCLRALLAQPAARRHLDRLLLRLPLLGNLIAKAEGARFSRTLATLLRNGLPVLSALPIVKETLANQAMRDGIDDVAASLKEGRGLAEPLRAAGRFPGLLVHLVQVGEETGGLEDMLFKGAEICEQEVQRAVERMLAVLTPALTIALALLIAGILGSILSAMMSTYELPF
jgi:general secretion pathway protein F